MKKICMVMAVGICCLITACGSSSSESEKVQETIVEKTEIETESESVNISESEEDVNMRDVIYLLIDYDVITQDTMQMYSDDELINMYNALMVQLERIDIESLGIDEIRNLLIDVNIMDEETANNLPAYEIINVYEEFLDHRENESDDDWWDEIREYYGMDVNNINTSSDTDNNLKNDNNGDYILSDSDSRYLTADDLNGLTNDELRIARNEIYARHGRMFDSADLDEYFNSKSWYSGTVPAQQFSETVLNDYEKKNAELIKSVEDGTVTTSASNVTNGDSSNGGNSISGTQEIINDDEYYTITTQSSFKEWWREAKIGDKIYIPNYYLTRVKPSDNQLCGVAENASWNDLIYLDVESTLKYSPSDRMQVWGTYSGVTYGGYPILSNCTTEFIN